MHDLVGQVIGSKYRLERRLGVGGIAEVYEAVHEQIGQHFAIKVLRPEFAALREIGDRMLTEARAASAVGHPGIVQVFDIGKLDTGEPYIVMELLQGDDLMQILRRHKQLPLDQAVGVCLHVLDALAAAHAKGVVHRDLKPENIVLVRGPGGEPWAKIIDFGIARLAREGVDALRQTAQGTLLGTPYYVSPEQARGVADIDGRADLYALGVMLFEMVTGRLPFEGRTVDEIVARALGEPFPLPRSIVPDLPAALEEVILRATARNRDQRFQTANEFARALRPLRGELVAVRLLDEGEFDTDPEPTEIRRLRELADRVPAGERIRASVPPPEGRRPSVPPPDGRRPSVPPPSDGRRPSVPPPSDGRQPSVPPPDGRRASAPGGRGSVPPPPPRLASSKPGVARGSVPGTSLAVFGVPRRTLVTGAIVGTAVAAAVTGALLLLLARGPSDGNRDAAPTPDPAAMAVAAPPASPASPSPSPVVDLVPRPVPMVAPPVPGDESATDAGGASPSPADAGQVPPSALDPSATPPASVAVRLVGLPAGTTATVDGRTVEPEFSLEPSAEPHALRVLVRGRVVWARLFTAESDVTIEVDVPRRLLAGAAADDAGSAADVSAGTAVTPRPDAGSQPLANPFQ